MAVILAGDIGGTKTNLGLFRWSGNSLEPIRSRISPTSDFQTIEDAVARFVGGDGRTIDAACFGVPGPVIGGSVSAVNVPWGVMREKSISDALSGKPVQLINDLGATAMGVIHLPDSKCEILQRGGTRKIQGNTAVIAAGTGLGEASLVYSAGRHHIVVSEGGHTDFAPHNAEQIELLRFLKPEFGHVSVERVLSGPGLFNIYRFIRSRSGEPEPSWLVQKLASEDPGAVVGEVAIAQGFGDCVRALEMFVDVYGAEGGNLALKVLALGGVYLAGGIAPKILPMLRDERFVRAFNDKGRLAPMLEQIPIKLSLDDNVALYGAAHCAIAML